MSVQEGKGARGDGLGSGRGHGGPGGQRSDETALTGDTLAKVTEAALAEVGSDATVKRAETDADGNATYEAHVSKADGTRETVYVDDSFQVVSVEEAASSRSGPAPGVSRSRHPPLPTRTLPTQTLTDNTNTAAATTL